MAYYDFGVVRRLEKGGTQKGKCCVERMFAVDIDGHFRFFPSSFASVAV